MDTNTAEVGTTKKPFFKRWGFWWCATAALLAIGAIGEKSDAGGASRDGDREAKQAKSHSQSAREFVKDYATRYGPVFDCSRIPNGAYMGFPDGKGVETFQLSVFPAGSSSGRTLIIAIRPDGRDWEILKRDYN